MGNYGSGRKAIYELTERYHTINVKSARCFGYQIVYSEQKNVVGKRAWIICPCCQRRCALLYFRLQSLPVCRKCLHLNYPSQRETFEEKQRTYERYLLEEGYLWGYDEWLRLPKRYLSYEEFTYHHHRGQMKVMRELLKLQVDTMRMLVFMLPYEKQVAYEARVLTFEGKKEPTIDDIAMAGREIDTLQELIAA